MGEALDPAVFFTHAFEIPQNVAYLVTAILALIVAAAAALTARPWRRIGTGRHRRHRIDRASADGARDIPGDHSLALAAGALHALAAAFWVGGLVAVTRHALRGDSGVTVAIGRFSIPPPAPL